MKKTLLQTLVESFLAEDQDTAKAAFHQHSIATARKMMAEASRSVTLPDNGDIFNHDETTDAQRSFRRHQDGPNYKHRLKHSSAKDELGMMYDMNSGYEDDKFGRKPDGTPGGGDMDHTIIWTKGGRGVVHISNLNINDQEQFDKVMSRFFTEQEWNVLMDIPGEMELVDGDDDDWLSYEPDYVSLKDFVLQMKKVVKRMINQG